MDCVASEGTEYVLLNVIVHQFTFLLCFQEYPDMNLDPKMGLVFPKLYLDKVLCLKIDHNHFYIFPNQCCISSKLINCN